MPLYILVQLICALYGMRLKYSTTLVDVVRVMSYVNHLCDLKLSSQLCALSYFILKLVRTCGKSILYRSSVSLM